MKTSERSVAALEKLELRQLLSGGSAVLTPDGTLTITGTEGDDLIVLTPGTGVIINGSGGGDFHSDYMLIHKVIVNARGGDDYILISDSFGTDADVTLNGGAGNDSFSVADSIAAVIGGDGNDTLLPSGETPLTSFDGGSGVDTIDMGHTLPNQQGPAPVDLRNFPTVENVLHAYADVGGNALDNYITLWDFRDSAGDLVPHYVGGGAGNDTVVGGWCTYFDGGSGDDTFLPEANFTFIGGSGRNTLDYSNWTPNLTLDLTKGTDNFGNTFIDVQNAIGGSGDDTLIGDNNRNVLIGGSGNDTITGNGGKDVLIGGSGDDVFYARDKKRDTILGGDGIDSAQRDKQDHLAEVETLLA